MTVDPRAAAPREPDEQAIPPHAPEGGWARRLLGPMHVTGVFWYRFHMWGVSILPDWGVTLFITIFTTFFFFFLRRIRRAIAANLVPVLGPCGWWRRQVRIYRTMWTFAWCLSERYERHGTTRAFRIDIENKEIWDSVTSRGTGFVLLTAHVGNFEVGSMLPATHEEHHVFVVREKEVDPRAQRFIEEVLKDVAGGRYTTIFQDEENWAQGMVLLDALEKGGVVAMQGDRPRQGARNVLATIFGRPFPLAAGPAALARAADVPLFPVFVFRCGRLHYRIVFRPPIEPLRGRHRGEDVAAMVARVAAEVEGAICAEPYQWFCFREVWNDVLN